MSRALPYESYKLAFTPGMVRQLYDERVTEDMLRDEGRFVSLEGSDGWWIPSGQVFYSPSDNDPPEAELAHARAHFFLPHRFGARVEDVVVVGEAGGEPLTSGFQALHVVG